MADTQIHAQSAPRWTLLRAGLFARTTSQDGTPRYGFTLRSLLFCMMMLAAVLPVAVFYTWVERNSYQRELASVHETHLIIAQNLSAALDRYARDAKSIFSLSVGHIVMPGNDKQFQSTLASFHICFVAVVNPDGTEAYRMEGSEDHEVDLPEGQDLLELKEIARAAGGEAVFSGIRQFGKGPHFFLLKSLPGDQFALAPVDPDYITTLQKSIAFGERGHSMMVDQYGHVVAHPNAEWQRISKDASKLPVVRAMMEGRTGVMQFYSPPMQADMIAGYTFVPETGWGVMVPQPIAELAKRAHEVQGAAVFVALFQLALGLLISWRFSSWLARPIRSIAVAARVLSRGRYQTRIGSLPGYMPTEISQTADAFDRMADNIKQTTARLQFALAEAEKISSERARLLEAAQAANAAKSQFVSMVSHELRTPLTSIKGALDLLNTSVVGDMPGPARSLLDVATRNGTRLATMIDDLLDLEKLDAGKLQFTWETADLRDIVSEAVEANEGYGALAGVTFRFDRPDAPLVARTDPGRLQQVLANLLSNAAKFSHDGQNVDITLFTEDDRAVIAVRDRGVGVPQGTGDSIFDAFVQADSSDTRVVGGTGLGLSIARMIVWRHDGTLTYDSTPGEGTTFTVKLPLLEETKE